MQVSCFETKEIYTAKQKISLIIDLNFTLSEEKKS